MYRFEDLLMEVLPLPASVVIHAFKFPGSGDPELCYASSRVHRKEKLEILSDFKAPVLTFDHQRFSPPTLNQHSVSIFHIHSFR